MNTLLPIDVLKASYEMGLAKEQTGSLLDVRSEGEFLSGSIPLFSNSPILTNSERHEVGTAYKQLGQDRAIQLGHQLVLPFKSQRVDQWEAWQKCSKNRVTYVMCWRGGLRSRIACEWLLERSAPSSVYQIAGGYKGVRKLLLQQIEEFTKHEGKIRILSGPTGSGKSALLRKRAQFFLDLEGYAAHRGSAFGRILGPRLQPSQATFENSLGWNLGLLHEKAKRNGLDPLIWLEDEGKMIGDLKVPDSLSQLIQKSGTIELVVPLDQRILNIIQEYVIEPIGSGAVSVTDLFSHFSGALLRIRKALGPERLQRLQSLMSRAFERQNDDSESFLTQPQVHEDWVRVLLTEYYDPRYVYGISKLKRRALGQVTPEQFHRI